MDGETTSTQAVLEFKAKCKALIKESKLKEALDYVTQESQNKNFQKLPIRDDLTFTHWWTKVCLKAGDLRSLDSACLTKINTLINLLITKEVKPKSKDE